MKSIYYAFILIALSLSATGQTDLTEAQIKQKCDSILLEGNLLYNYESAAWIGTDLAGNNKKVMKKLVGYFVYQSGDTLLTLMMDKKEQCIAEFAFRVGSEEPFRSVFRTRTLTPQELKLWKVRNGAIDQILKKPYPVESPPGYSLNVILIPDASGYKLYLLTGTSKPNVIPFGNDYLFWIDPEGKIESMHKFHSRLIPAETRGPDGEQVIKMMHSHLKTEPFITATDICTFKLYARLYGLNEFTVYSPALSRRFIYKLDTDTIEVSE
jgi:hypothetical protein